MGVLSPSGDGILRIYLKIQTMKLHLPKLLRNSVLACITAVAGIATTTVGTATFTGGVVAFALSSQQAAADYVWNGGSGNKTGDDWKNESSWNMVDGSKWNPGNKDSINGPGTSGSDMWDKVVIDGGDEGVVFGSEDSHDIPLEGWAPKYELSNAKLYANMYKLQPGPNDAIFTVRNNSLLDFQMGGGSFQGTSILTVGENSGIIFRMQNTASTAAMNITMESSTGYVKFLAGSNINHTGAITLNPVLGELNSDWGSVDLGITAQNVTLSNLTVNLGTTFDGWTRVDTQITEANYAGFGNCYSIIKNAEGKYMLTYAVFQEGSSCIWNGGELSWANDTAFSNKTFSAGSVVEFSDSDADVVLQENIEAASVVIDEGVTVSLDGNTHELNIIGALHLDGTLVLKSDCLSVVSTVAGDNAELVLDAGAEKQWELADLPQTGTNACTAKVTVASGSLYLTSGSQTMGDITVEDGAGLRLGGNARVGKIVLNGDGGWTSDGAVVNAALLRNNGQVDITVNAVELASDSTMQVDTGKIIINGELSGNVLTKTGAGTLVLKGGATCKEIVMDGGKLYWAGDQNSTVPMGCDKITLNAGTYFEIAHQASVNKTDIVLNGASIKAEDQSPDGLAGSHDFGKLTVLAESSIQYNWNGALHFSSLTGDANLQITGGQQDGRTWFKSVEDFNGEITASNMGNHSVVIGAVNQSADKVMTIATAVTLQDFAKTGEGSLVVTGAATLQGNLAVNYEGTLTLSGAVSVAADSVLSYTGDNEKVMSLGALNTNVVIDILAVSDSVRATGVNLGIALESNIDSEIEALKSKLTVVGLDDYTLTSKDGLAWLSSSASIQLDWDKNWGAAGLAGAPGALEATEITSTIALSGNEAYDKDGYVAINATTGGDNVVIYGGASNGESGAGLVSSEDVWIKATSGKFLGLVGASRAQNWMNGNGGWKLNADTHIEVRGADTEVGHIIGGYHQECNSPVFNGSSYISVFEGKVTGNIAGSSATVDGDNYTSYHTGNTNVFIYVPLGTDTTAPDMSTAADPKHVVVGGGISLVHGTTTRVARFEMTGDTNVTIDLSEYSGDATTFDKAVYGGNYTNRTNTGCISKIVGNTNVTIKGGNIEFTGDIVGGSLIQRGDATISGTASTTITGGTFSGNVVAGSFAVDGSTGGDTAQVGSTVLTISGGTFNGNVYGGTYMYSGGVSVDVDSVDVNISAGTVTNLVGGNLIGGAGTAAVDAGLGNVDITVSGGEVAKLVGGSIVWRNNAGAVVNQGDITISLNGGTVGDVYAAGSQQGSTTISTASTKVVLGKDVTVNAGAIISGGYTAAEGVSGSVVTGKSTLVFSGSGAMDRRGLNFTDFNTVEVTAADANVTIGTLTTTSAVEKTGAGTLTLAGGSYALSGGLTVSEGMLATSTATTLGGALTLGDGSYLDVAQGALTLAGETGAELTLGTNLVLNTTVLGMGDNVIISGVSSVTGLTEQVAAGSFFSSINGITALDDFFIKLDGTNLILVNDSVHEITWDSANSEWKVGSAFGTNEDGEAANWAAENVAIFGNLGDTPVTEEITVVGTGADAVAPLSVTIDAGEGNTYSFSGATISTPDLEVLSGIAKFGSGTLDMNSLNVIVVDGVLDLSAVMPREGDGSAWLEKLTIATGNGTINMSESIKGMLTSEVLQYNVNLKAYDALEIAPANGGSMTMNVVKDITVLDGTSGWAAGQFRAGCGVTLNVLDGGSINTSDALELAYSGNAGTGTALSLVDGGSIKVDSIKQTNNTGKQSTFTMTGGTLELTGTAGIASGISTVISGGELVANTADWGITGATVGGVKVTGSNTITLTDATLTSTIDNSAGKLAFGGTIDITSAGYVTTETPSEYSVGTNEGYVRVNTNYVVANTADTNLSIAAGTTWTVDGSATNVSYANGVVTVAGTDWSTDFYVRTDKDLSGIAKTNDEGEALATIVLTGGGLNMNEALGEGVTIRIEKEGQSVVNIGDGLTLAAGLVTGTDATHKLELKGNGTYALADGSTTLGNAVLGDWAGTVKVTNAYQNDGKMDIDAKLNPLADADSTVEVTNVKGYLDTGKALTANVRLVNATDGTAAITITNGNSDDTAGTRKAVIQGTVSGSGDIAFATWSGMNGRYVTYEFTGEISGWNGSFINKSPQSNIGTANVVIDGDTEINASILNDANRYEGSKLYLTIGGDSNVTMNGAVDVDKLTVSQNTSFTNTVAVADLVNTASASFANDLALSTLDNTGSITATGKSISVIGATTGAGSITAGALTLQAASNTVGDLTLTGALTLGTADAASTLNAGVLDIGGDVVVNKLTADLITSTGGLAVGSLLNLSIEEEVLRDAITAKGLTSLVIGTITDLDIAKVTLNGVTTFDVGQYTFSINDSAASGVLELIASANGYTWGGNENDPTDNSNWSEPLNWEEGIAPGGTSTTQAVKFLGAGSSEVVIGNSMTIKYITVDIDGYTPDSETLTDSDPKKVGYAFAATKGTNWNVLTVEESLSVNKGLLNVGSNVDIEAKKRVEVLAAGELRIAEMAFVNAHAGIENAGKITIDASSTPGGTNAGALYVQGNGSIANSGELYVNGTLLAGQGMQNNPDGNDIINSGTIVNTGTIKADGNLLNTGSVSVDMGESEDKYSQLQVWGNVDNEGTDSSLDIGGGYVDVIGDLSNEGSLSISGGAIEVDDGLEIKEYNNLTVGGELDNSGTLTVRDAGTKVQAGSMTNSGTISVEGGSVSAGSLDNEGSIAISGGSLTAGTADNSGSLTVTGGTVTLGAADTGAEVTSMTNSGTLSIGGELVDGEFAASMTVNGDLNNTGGTIIIGSAAVEDDPDTEEIETAGATYGSLTVTGNLTGTGAKENLVVNSGSSLSVGGDLTATDVVLEFGGAVTVGGTATMKGLTISEGASFSANDTLTVGALTGTGKVEVTNALTITGDITGFEGTLTNNGTWTVESKGVIGNLTLTTAGHSIAGTAGEVTVNGKDTAELRLLSGATLAGLDVTAGKVTLGGDTFEALTVTNGIAVKGADATLDLNDKSLESSPVITMTAGKLANASVWEGRINIDSAAEAAHVDLGGLTSAATLNVDVLKAGSTISGFDSLTLAGNNVITLNKDNVSAGIFGSDGSITLAENAKMTFDVNALLAGIKDWTDNTVTVKVGGDLTKLIESVIFDASLGLFNVTAELVDKGSIKLTKNEVVYEPDSDEGDTFFIATDDGHDIVGGDGLESDEKLVISGDNVAALENSTAIIIDHNTTIDLSTAESDATKTDGVVLSNLMGTETSNLDGATTEPVTLTIQGNTEAEVKTLVTINPNLEHKENGNSTGDAGVVEDAAADNGADVLNFSGNLEVTGADLQYKATDATSGELATDTTYNVNGNLTADKNSQVIVTSGVLALNGTENKLEGGITVDQTNGTLVLNGENTTIGGTVAAAKDAEGNVTNGEGISIAAGAAATLADNAVLTDGVSIVGDSASSIVVAGTTTIKEGASISGSTLSVGEGKTLSVAGEGTTLDVSTITLASGSTMELDGNATVKAEGLAGSGALESTDEATVQLTVSDETTYSGDLSKYSGSLCVQGEGVQVLSGAASGKNVDLHIGEKPASMYRMFRMTRVAPAAEDAAVASHVDLDMRKNDLEYRDIYLNNENSILCVFADRADGTNGMLTADDLNLHSGTLNLHLNLNEANGKNSIIDVTHIDLEGAEVHVNVAGISDEVAAALFNGTLSSITLATAESVDGKTAGNITADGIITKYFGNSASVNVVGTNLVLSGTLVTAEDASWYQDNAESANGTEGAKLLDYAFGSGEQQKNTDLADVLDTVETLITSGNSTAADEAMAAVAGASTAVLGMAAVGDVDRQLRAIRNRTTTMGVDQTVVNHDMPYFNAWINAEGDQREMKDDGTLGGYKLNSWGGTVGFDVDIAPTFTAGLALTAMYGDLDATGADKATGNMDTYYVSAFARYCDSAWTHTFVATVGMGDISLDRTVLGHELKGETESMSFGFMYEVGRVFALDEDATACIQPVFNVAWRHASVDGYTEKGSDAALEVGDQTLNTVTFGLGARLQAVVGESMYNRTSIFECRLLAKADVGDRDSAADVALAGGEAEVKSAETGAFGLEAGAGLTIPLGDEGSSIFMDASVELRADYTNVNGTVGYRINF